MLDTLHITHYSPLSPSCGHTTFVSIEWQWVVRDLVVVREPSSSIFIWYFLIDATAAFTLYLKSIFKNFAHLNVLFPPEIVEGDNLKMQSEIDWTLTLFMLSLFFKSRADWWSVDNQISSLISLNVVTLEKAVVTVHTRKLDMTYVWMEICR